MYRIEKELRDWRRFDSSVHNSERILPAPVQTAGTMTVGWTAHCAHCARSTDHDKICSGQMCHEAEETHFKSTQEV